MFTVGGGPPPSAERLEREALIKHAAFDLAEGKDGALGRLAELLRMPVEPEPGFVAGPRRVVVSLRERGCRIHLDKVAENGLFWLICTAALAMAYGVATVGDLPALIRTEYERALRSATPGAGPS